VPSDLDDIQSSGTCHDAFHPIIILTCLVSPTSALNLVPHPIEPEYLFSAPKQVEIETNMAGMQKSADVGQIVDSRSLEHHLLAVVLILIYASYAALGRDIFFNHLYMNNANLDDPIGKVLNYIRVFACVLAVTLVASRTSFSWAFNKVPLLFSPFIAMALISPLWALEPLDVLRNSLVLTAIWIGLPMLIHRLGLAQTTKISLYIIAWVLIISCFLAIFLPSIGVHDGREVMQSSHTGRWRGIFAHKNGLGPWAAFGSVLLFTHSKFAGGSTLFWWVARASALACLIFSGSATAILMAVFLLGLYLGFLILRHTSAAFVTIAGLIAALAFGGAFGLFGDKIFELLERDSTLTGRSTIWDMAVNYFWVHPYFGNGYQTLGGPVFQAALLNAFAQDLRGPESGYLSLLLDLGIIGFTLYFVPLVLAVRTGFEWLNHVDAQDRSSIEFMLMITFATLMVGITDSQPFLCTGFDGVISFSALFSLMTMPKSPAAMKRTIARLMKRPPLARGGVVSG
jgi:O-antigen ligase